MELIDLSPHIRRERKLLDPRSSVAKLIGGDVGCGPCIRANYLSNKGKWLQLAKLLAIVTIPILGGWAFSIFSLFETGKDQSDAHEAKQTMEKAIGLGNLIYRVQMERDTSVLYVSKLGPGIKKFLLLEYEKTDEAISALSEWPTELAAHASTHFKSKKALKNYISQHRKAFDSETTDLWEEIRFYSDIAQVFMVWMTENIRDVGFGQFWKSLVSFQKITQCLLDEGAERAYGAMFFAQGTFPRWDDFELYNNRIYNFKNYYEVITFYSDIVDPFLELENRQANLTMHIRNFRREIRAYNVTGIYRSPDKAQWYYDNITLRIEYIKDIQQSIGNRIKGHMGDSMHDLVAKIIVYASVAALVLLLFPMILLFTEALTNNIQKYSKILVDTTSKLDVEREKTNALLYEMIPKSVVERLKTNLKVESEFFNSATVLFTSIVDFTKLTMDLSPLDLVGMVNNLYTAIDELIGHYDVYKVETINDTYMVVSGVPTTNGERHASEITLLALDIVQMIRRTQTSCNPTHSVQLQLGASTGSVSAGIVGSVMLRYCLFGDTVNTASRMKSNGHPNRVHISESMYRNLKKTGKFGLQSRGAIEVKGKGLMNTYWVNDTVNGGQWQGESGSGIRTDPDSLIGDDQSSDPTPGTSNQYQAKQKKSKIGTMQLAALGGNPQQGTEYMYY